MFNPTPHLPKQPFVYIVDSPSPSDLAAGYTIGMGLRDALRSIRIPHYYILAVGQNELKVGLDSWLEYYVNQMRAIFPHTDPVPIIHLCMHGANTGIGLTDGTFVQWDSLRQLLAPHKRIKGCDPFVCMASCNGIGATSMPHAFDGVFEWLIGNGGTVYQGDLTVAYLTFYNQLFWKGASVENAVHAMRNATGDYNFQYALGENLRSMHFQQLISTVPFPQPVL